MSDAVDFLYADKHESLLQIDTKFFWWVWSSIPKVPKKASLQCLYNIPKKVRDEVDFFDADKHQSFLTVDFNTLGIKVFYNVTGMIMKTWRAWWWEWSSILKVLKVTSLQCLYNISKKTLWMEFSIFDVSYWFLMTCSESPDMSKVPRKRGLLNFSNILRKSITTAFVFCYDAKHSDTLLGSSHVCCYLFLGGCGQKWAWSFRSWNSEICCISREWIDKMNWFFCMLIQI